jgi:hypothetical protein
MGRVIHTASTGKTRNQLRRTIAELLRRLSGKNDVDDETKDMVAAIVFCLREIDAGIQSSAAAWEKRDYWVKADHFRMEWRWVPQEADALTEIVHTDEWDELPQAMIRLLPRFADVNVAKYTRKPDTWQNAYEELCREADA